MLAASCGDGTPNTIRVEVLFDEGTVGAIFRLDVTVRTNDVDVQRVGGDLRFAVQARFGDGRQRDVTTKIMWRFDGTLAAAGRSAAVGVDAAGVVTAIGERTSHVRPIAGDVAAVVEVLVTAGAPKRGHGRPCRCWAASPRERRWTSRPKRRRCGRRCTSRCSQGRR